MITAEMILNAFFTSVTYKAAVHKNHGRIFSPYTLFKVFNKNIINLYNYTGNNTDFKSHYSFNDFTNLFYDVVRYDEELPEYVQEKFTIYFNRSHNVEIDKEYIYYALNEIRACIVQLKLDEAVKDFWIKDNERKTKKIRELVFNHSHCCKAVPAVCPLITWAENHNQLNHEFIYKIFEYGYIMGKRAERARKKTK